MKYDKIMFWFGLDGTLYNLYQLPNWLERIRNHDASVYEETHCTIKRGLDALDFCIRFTCGMFDYAYQSEVGIITSGTKTSTYDFDQEAEQAKRDWFYGCKEISLSNMVDKNNFFFIPYGTSKTKVIQDTRGYDPSTLHILFDSSKEARDEWKEQGCNYRIINANRNMMKQLQVLLDRTLD